MILFCEHHQCDHKHTYCIAHKIYYCQEFYRECPAWTGHFLSEEKVDKPIVKTNEINNPQKSGKTV